MIFKQLSKFFFYHCSLIVLSHSVENFVGAGQLGPGADLVCLKILGDKVTGHGLTDLHGIGAALIVKSRSALAVLQYLLKGSFKEAIGHLVPVTEIFVL